MANAQRLRIHRNPEGFKIVRGRQGAGTFGNLPLRDLWARFPRPSSTANESDNRLDDKGAFLMRIRFGPVVDNSIITDKSDRWH